MDLARRLNHPIYDCVYLALAERERARFVTADQRLLRRAVSLRAGTMLVDLRSLGA
jgi:predicted nucleic acid-binding protein